MNLIGNSRPSLPFGAINQNQVEVCVAFAGFCCVVMRTTRRAEKAVILGVRPGREASRFNPTMPRVRNRLRQRDTFLVITFSARAICLSCRPSAAVTAVVSPSALLHENLRNTLTYVLVRFRFSHLN